MPDVNYVVTIRNEGGFGGSGSPGAGTAGSGGVGGGIVPSSGGNLFADVLREKQAQNNGVAPTINGDSIAKANNGMRFAQASMAALASTIVTAEINRVEMRTGHATLQQQIAYTYGTGKRILASTGALIAGAATGNPIAIAASVAGIAMRVVQIGNAITDINIQRSVEGIGIEQANIRAGAFGNRGAER